MGHSEDFASTRRELQPEGALSQQGPALTQGFTVSLWLQVSREQTKGQQGSMEPGERRLWGPGRARVGAVGEKWLVLEIFFVI